MRRFMDVTAALTLAALSGAAHAQDAIVVNTLEDYVDFFGARQVDDLPGADGKISFREAVIAANNTPGPNLIEFAIPQNEWWLVNNYALLRLEEGVFELTDDETTVDFSTQTDFTGDTNPNGTEVGIYGLEANGWGTPAIIIHGSNCTIRGLGQVHLRGASISVWNGSHDNRLVGNATGLIELNPYPGTTTGNIIGGTTPEDRNINGSVRILCGANDNIVIGNHLISVAVQGSPNCQFPNQYPLRNRIGGPTPEERNVFNDFGSYGEEGFPIGQGIMVEHARDTLIEGNYIGTTEDGMARFPQRGTAGVRVVDAIDTTIRNNLIAGIRVVGVNHYAGQIFGQAIHLGTINHDNSGVIIENNLIGTDATGMNPITTRAGIVISPLTFNRTISNVTIGSPDGAAGNVIAFTELEGIRVASQGESIEIAGNDIFANGTLGIDLLSAAGGAGVTLNDAGDADDGANSLQNFPVITSASFDGSDASFAGTLNSRPSREYRVEFFASAQADPSGYGEGEHFLGSTTVTTDAGGNATFQATLPAAAIADGWVATATATDTALAETSEFGQAVAFTIDEGCDADINGDGVLDFFDVADYLDLFSAGDPAADLNGDGTLDFFDVADYLDAFSAGCP